MAYRFFSMYSEEGVDIISPSNKKIRKIIIGGKGDYKLLRIVSDNLSNVDLSLERWKVSKGKYMFNISYSKRNNYSHKLDAKPYNWQDTSCFNSFSDKESNNILEDSLDYQDFNNYTYKHYLVSPSKTYQLILKAIQEQRLPNTIKWVNSNNVKYPFNNYTVFINKFRKEYNSKFEINFPKIEKQINKNKDGFFCINKKNKKINLSVFCEKQTKQYFLIYSIAKKDDYEYSSEFSNNKDKILTEYKRNHKLLYNRSFPLIPYVQLKYNNNVLISKRETIKAIKYFLETAKKPKNIKWTKRNETPFQEDKRISFDDAIKEFEEEQKFKINDDLPF